MRGNTDKFLIRGEVVNSQPKLPYGPFYSCYTVELNLCFYIAHFTYRQRPVESFKLLIKFGGVGKKKKQCQQKL